MAETPSQPHVIKEEKEKKIGYLFQPVINGLMLSLIEVPVWLGFLALVFSGALSEYLGQAMLFLIAGSLISMSLIGFLSSWKGSIALVQDVPSAILIVISADIVAAMSLTASSKETFITIVVTIGLASVTTGIILYLLGVFRLGNMVRYLPYPVIAGFLGGTGWLLLSGGILSSLPDGSGDTLFQLETLVYWLPALLVGIFFYWADQRISTPLLLPGLMTIIGIAFHLGMGWLGYDLMDLMNGGWLLNINTVALGGDGLSIADIQLIDWVSIGQQGGKLVVLGFASAVAMLLNSSGFELKVDADLDPNQDLRTTGIANILSGFLGGWPAYISPALTSVNAKNNKQLPMTGLLLALFGAIILLFATQYLAQMPKFLVGAVIVYVGVGFLMDWVVAPAKRLTRRAYSILLLIIATVVFWGLMEGVAVGLVMAVVLFVFNYSRIKVVRHQFSGSHQRSRVTRPIDQWVYLDSVADERRIFQLQGFMFFGTANRLLDEVRKLIEQSDIRYLILDFQRVSGIDTTALMSIAKIEQVLTQKNATLLLSALKEKDVQKLGNELDRSGSGEYLMFGTTDEALQHCENAQLEVSGLDLDSPVRSLPEQLNKILPETNNIPQMLDLMDRKTFVNGQQLIEQGTEADEMFFIDEGMVTAQVEREDGSIVRLETMGRGRVVGELGFYLGQERTASVVSEGESAVYVLTKQRLAEIEQDHPTISSTLHQLIVHLLSDRVTHLVRVVDILQV